MAGMESIDEVVRDDQTVVAIDAMWTAMHEFEVGRLSLERLAWRLMVGIVTLGQAPGDPWLGALRAQLERIERISDGVVSVGSGQPSDGQRQELRDALDHLRRTITEG